MQRLYTRKRPRFCLLLTLSVLLLGLSGCGSTSNLPSFDLNGTTWFMYKTVNGSAGELESDPFSFTQSSGDNNFTGSTPPPNSLSLSGSINGKAITFSWIDGSTTYTFGGSFNADGSLMSGNWTSTTNGQTTPMGTWNAVINLAPSVDITGSWNLTNSTSGIYQFTYAAATTGNNITGTTPDGLPIIGRIGSFTVFFSWVASDGSTTLMYTGTADVAATSMSGTWTDTNGNSGTWSATKNS